MPSSPIEFPYIYRLGGTRRVLIPIVQADVQLPFGYHPIRPLLDTGADYTMLPKFIAETAGLNISSLPLFQVKGVEGRSIMGRKHKVTLRIGQLLLPPIPCIYVEDPTRPLLLGREGFFDLFNITFDNRRKKVVLTPLF